MPKSYPIFNVVGTSVVKDIEASASSSPQKRVEEIEDIKELRQYAKDQIALAKENECNELSRYKALAENLQIELKEEQCETLKWKQLYLEAAIEKSPELPAEETVKALRQDLSQIDMQIEQLQHPRLTKDSGFMNTVSATNSTPNIKTAKRPSSGLSQNSTSSSELSNTPKTEPKRTFAENYVSPYAERPPKPVKQLSPAVKEALIEEYNHEAMLSCQNLTPVVEEVDSDLKTGKLVIDNVRPNRMTQKFDDSDRMEKMDETCFGDTVFEPQLTNTDDFDESEPVISLLPQEVQNLDVSAKETLQTNRCAIELDYQEAYPLTINADDICSVVNKIEIHFGLARELLFVQPQVENTIFISTSQLRREIAGFLSSISVQCSGITLQYCVVYGKIELPEIRDVCELFHYYSINQVQDGFEVAFESEKDCQNFYTLGEMNFAKIGRSVIVARKAK